MLAIDAKLPIIVPGKIIVLVSAAGIRVIGIAIWQNGTSPSIMLAPLIAILPLTSMRCEMKEITKHTERVIKSIDLNLSVFPVCTMRKKRTLKKKKVIARANKRSSSAGIFPLVSIMKVSSIIGRQRKNVLNKPRLAGTDWALASLFIFY